MQKRVTEDVLPCDKHPSLLEMWNVIESVGIKRELVEKSFPTPEDVLELYLLVEKKIHYQREQDMIKRLKIYVEKLKTDTFLEVIKNSDKSHDLR